MNDTFGRQLGRVDRMLGLLENGLNLLAGGLIFALMLLGVAQIVLRTVFDAPIFGYIDIVEVSMVGFAVLSIAFVQRVGGHVRMELVIGRLQRPLALGRGGRGHRAGRVHRRRADPLLLAPLRTGVRVRR